MIKQVSFSVPVADLPKSLAFFKALGFSHNPQFTDDTAACVVINETIFVMRIYVYAQLCRPRRPRVGALPYERAAAAALTDRG